MEFRELKTFQVVANLLSFNKAAGILHIAQSTVSAQIRSLEAGLGRELFVRSGKKISLTPAGVKLLEYTQRLVNIEKEIESVLGKLDERYGNLTIKTPQSVSIYFFPELLREFQILFPKVGFDIDWCTSHNLADILNSGIIDLAFLITDGFEDVKLQTEVLAKIRLCLAVSPKNELAGKRKVSIKDLNGKTLLFAKSECNYSTIMQRMLVQADVSPEKIITINSIEAIKQLVVLGDGIALVPDVAIAREVKAGTISTLRWGGAEFNAKLLMIWSKEKRVSVPLQAFKVMVEKTFHSS